MESNKLKIKQDKILVLFKEQRNPMQSTTVDKDCWIGILFDDKSSDTDDKYDDIMGWFGSTNMLKQVKLNFNNLNDAEIYAKKYKYKIFIKNDEEVSKKTIKKSYLEKFIS